jgi:superfamily II DNA or RNA helicase
VRLRANHDRVGLVVGQPFPYGDSYSYKVFFNADDMPLVNEQDLELLPVERLQVLTRESFLRQLLLAKLENPLTDLLYAYEASRTQAEAYQFKPVLKFLDSPTSGILIADEVGLGKTIEAAIIHQELSARETVRRVLVVCPAGLREKWKSELATRFDEQFQIMFRREIAEDLRLYRDTGGHQPLKGIVGLETIRAREVQELFDEFQVSYDLVIIDEAHHLRTTGRLSNQIGEKLATLADHLVLLTATPLQTDRQDLFNLLQFIDDSQFTSFPDFVEQLAPNALLNEAIRALRRDPPGVDAARDAMSRIPGLPAAGQVTGHPNFEPVMHKLSAPGPAMPRDEVVRVQRDIDAMNVMSTVYTRTKKADVTGVAKRKAFTMPVPLGDGERDFYAAVLDHARAEAKAHGKTWIAGFTGMMRERQAASCMAATRDYYVELARNRHVELGTEAFDDSVALDSALDGEAPEAPEAPAATEEEALRRVLVAIGHIGSRDTKLDVFITTMREALSEANGGKAIVFSFFRRTLAYLEKALQAAGFSVIVIHGDVKPADRVVRIDRFRSDPKIQIMLASEVGAEGLDFQFCDTLVNYDLPWNPMKVEQRIGRIDRYGQKRPQIRIYSFVLEGSIEERILSRLYTRIGIFEESIGDLEPILGPAVAELTREVFAASLTPAEEAEVLERNLRMVIQRRMEEQELDKRRAELLGQDSLLLQRIGETVTSGRYISSSELRAIVTGFIEGIGSTATLADKVGDGRTITLTSDGELAQAVLRHATETHDSRQMATEFVGRLQRGAAIPGTFDGAVAHESPRLQLFSLRHPLVRAAVDHHRALRSRRAWLPFVDLDVYVGDLPADGGPWPEPGDYTFTLWLMGLSGAHKQTRLVPVAFDAAGRRAVALEDRVLRLVQDFSLDSGREGWSREMRQDLHDRARLAIAGIADQLQAEATDRNEAWIAVRRATVQRTMLGKIRKRRILLEQASDVRIINMRRGEIENLEAELRRRVYDLERQREVAAESTTIGMGVLRVVAGGPPSMTEDVADPDRDLRGTEVLEGYPEPPRRLGR